MADQVEEVQAEKPPIFIPQIAGFLYWLETLVITVSSLMLTFVAVLTVASALNGGKLLADNATLNQAYAWCQGIGVEGQLSGVAFRAVRAGHHGKGGQAFWFWTLTLILALVSFLAIGAVNYQQSFNVTFTQALAQVGISQDQWVWMRAGILVVLLVLAAAMRYQPAAARESVDARIAKMEEQAQLNAARARLASQGVGAFIGGVRGALNQPPAAPLS